MGYKIKKTDGTTVFDNIPLFYKTCKEELNIISPNITIEETIEIIRGFFYFLFCTMEDRHLTTMKIPRFGTFKPMTNRIANHLQSLLNGYHNDRISADLYNLSLFIAKNYFQRTKYSTTRIDKFNYIYDQD